MMTLVKYKRLGLPHHSDIATARADITHNCWLKIIIENDCDENPPPFVPILVRK